ncbi:hypothetical protein Taro_045711 [Colocasia esculenta]|uniref:Uncharacterized protein n=1 Tax=Colocasia esculenta TaxID=4460 RepID=A0A843WQ74_COLES|nr:hypothetical protein [Colocasia esculenta]
MGSRSSKVSPSSLCLRSQMLREAIASPSFIGFSPKSSPICSKAVVRFTGVPGTLEDGYMTPRSRGRSVISKMSRSPYFKQQPTITLKDGEIMASGYPGPSTSTQTTSNIAFSSGKQVLKRSSVSESATGPIRRIRQKSNLVSSLEDVISQIPRKLLPTANSSVPLRSREMEEKIFQQLDKLVPSPKGKSAEARTVSRDELPSMLSSDVLHETASKSVAKTDALSLLNVEANDKLEISSNFHTVSLSPMKGKAKNSHSKSLLGTGIATEATEVGNVDASITETRPVIGSLDSLPSATTFDSLRRSSTFKMQAPDVCTFTFALSATEDSLEQEDDRCRRDISRLSDPREEKIQTDDHKSFISEIVVTKKALISSESMSDSNIKLSKMVGKGVLDATTIADKDASFLFQVSLPPSTECLSPVTHILPSLPAEVPVGSSEGNAVPVFTFGSKNTALVFSASMMSYSDPAGQEIGARFRGQLFRSISTSITAPVECAEFVVAEKPLKSGYLIESGGTSSSFAPTTSPTSSNLQFVTSAPSSRSNGSLTSNATTFSASSTSAAILSGSLSSAIISGGPASVSSCSNGPSGLPAFSMLPSIQFGSSSSAISTNCTFPVVESISTGSEPKLPKDSRFVHAGTSSVSSIFSSTGSSIFGLSAAAASSATTFGRSMPVFCSQAAQSGDGTPFGQNAGQSGSVSPPFGLAGSSIGFSSSTLGSSITSGKPLGLCSGFGPNSTLSLSLDASSTSLASTMKPLSAFDSSSQSTAASMFNSGFGSSISSSSVSIFGMSSATSATTSFSSVSMSPFSVSSSAATTPSVFSLPQAMATSASAFSFTFGATTTSPPVSSAVPGSPGNDQMNVEENMADHVVQAPSSVLPMFGQPSNVPPSSLPFSSTHTTSGAPVFQFTSSQPSALAQSQTPFQTTGSFEFGRSFSMGSGGIDKSGRRFIKAKRDKHRKK